MSFFDEPVTNIVPLIIFDGEKYYADEETLQWLNELKGSVGIVACAGKYRTGKSFLQNCLSLAEPGTGFGVGETIQACTKGIWLHKKIFKGFTFESDRMRYIICFAIQKVAVCTLLMNTYTLKSFILRKLSCAASTCLYASYSA